MAHYPSVPLGPQNNPQAQVQEWQLELSFLLYVDFYVVFVVFFVWNVQKTNKNKPNRVCRISPAIVVLSSV